MLDGSNWDESKWDWKLSLLKLRKFISNKDDNIFVKSIKKDIASTEEVNKYYLENSFLNNQFLNPIEKFHGR